MMKGRIFISKSAALLISTLAAILFLFLSSVKLDGQGLYYDELHQATASFAYTGQVPFQFATLTFRRLPIMNMNYSGAVKTAVYGLYMRFLDVPFSVISWRLVGILAVCAALLLFGVFVGKRLSRVGVICFLFLVITDVTVLLTTRHDWGPTALALLLRIALIAIWFRGELSGQPGVINSLWLGVLVGVSIFEKLSNVVLLLPLLLMIALSPYRRNIRHILSVAIGGLVGSIPLILANLLSIYKTGSPISLKFQSVDHAYSLTGFLNYFKSFLSLGAGVEVRSFILGNAQPFFKTFELVFVSLLILLIITVLIKDKFTHRLFRLSGIMLLCYLGTMVGLYILPQGTWVHHWVIGTPFQYASAALLLAGLKEKYLFRDHLNFGYSASILIVVVVLFRILGLISVEQSLIRGDTGVNWDISFTKVGEFAASKPDDALFIAAEWGVANQMICFLNGRSGTVFQFDWGHQNAEDVVNTINKFGRSEVYFVLRNSQYFPKSAITSQILRDVFQSIAPEWEEQPVEEEVANLRSVRVTKYSKVDRP